VCVATVVGEENVRQWNVCQCQ